MVYVLAEIVLYLVGAGLIGFVVGWLVRGGLQKKSSKSNVQVEETVMVPKEEPTQSVKEEVSEVADKSEANISVPELLSEAKEEGKDKLSTIKGIGPVIEKQLNELGIYHFEQIASWTKAQEEWIGTQMAFPKRVSKEEWVKQAKELTEKK